VQIRHSEEAFVSANGLRLCYDAFGNATDAPMILVMGLASQLVLWDDDFCKLLASQGRYVIRFDNRDIGRSTYLDELPVPNIPLSLLRAFFGKPVKAAYTLLDMATDTVALMDALAIAKVDLVGASMGGAILQELAIVYPERIKTLTLMMSSSGDLRLQWPTRAAFRALMRTPPRERTAYLEYYEELWIALSGDGYPIDKLRTQRQGMLAYNRGIHPAGSARQLGAILASGNRKPGLRAVTVPTLIVQGLNDPLIRPSHGRDLAKTIPGAKLEMVSGMGHTLPQRCWSQIARAIDDHAQPPVEAVPTPFDVSTVRKPPVR
jgi:pimeloyl-ACP methyl ester carboxylesterase